MSGKLHLVMKSTDVLPAVEAAITRFGTPLKQRAFRSLRVSKIYRSRLTAIHIGCSRSSGICFRTPSNSHHRKGGSKSRSGRTASMSKSRSPNGRGNSGGYSSFDFRSLPQNVSRLPGCEPGWGWAWRLFVISSSCITDPFTRQAQGRDSALYLPCDFHSPLEKLFRPRHN